MRKLFVGLAACTLLIYGCSEKTTEDKAQEELENKESAYEVLKKEVMRIHDDVMPESSTIIEYSKKIRAAVDSLSEDASSQGQQLIVDLKAADKAMMEWMRQYDDPEAVGMKLDSAIAYLKDQKVKIKEVDSLMRTSLKNAKEYIEDTVE